MQAAAAAVAVVVAVVAAVVCVAFVSSTESLCVSIDKLSRLLGNR